MAVLNKNFCYSRAFFPITQGNQAARITGQATDECPKIRNYTLCLTREMMSGKASAVQTDAKRGSFFVSFVMINDGSGSLIRPQWSQLGQAKNQYPQNWNLSAIEHIVVQRPNFWPSIHPIQSLFSQRDTLQIASFCYAVPVPVVTDL